MIRRRLSKPLILGACVALAACPSPRRDRPAAAATAAPQFAASMDSTPREEFLRYAQSLQYDTSVLASDAQHLIVRRGDASVPGPFARISPAVGSESNDDAALRAGRIIARITLTHEARSEQVYVWADSGRSGHRVVLVPSSADLAPLPIGMAVHDHDSAAVDLRRALWVIPMEGGLTICETCQLAKWCRTNPLLPDMGPIIDRVFPNPLPDPPRRGGGR